MNETGRPEGVQGGEGRSSTKTRNKKSCSNFQVKDHFAEIMLSVCVLPPTTEKVMHVFLSSDSADFILIDFRLLDYL